MMRVAFLNHTGQFADLTNTSYTALAQIAELPLYEHDDLQLRVGDAGLARNDTPMLPNAPTNAPQCPIPGLFKVFSMQRPSSFLSRGIRNADYKPVRSFQCPQQCTNQCPQCQINAKIMANQCGRGKKVLVLEK